MKIHYYVKYILWKTTMTMLTPSAVKSGGPTGAESEEKGITLLEAPVSTRKL
jgi:hypothetical protein